MKKEKRSNAVFYGLMGIMLGLFVISLIATGGKSIYQFLFYDRKDIFMDFFNSINDCFSGDPYGKKCIYPPLTYVIYTIFSKFLPMDMSKKDEKDINISKLDKSLEGQGLLEDADDAEYERTLAQQRREAEERERQVLEQAEAERRERERQEEKERERRLAQERIELMKLKSGVIDESESSIKEEHDQIRELHGFEKVQNFFYHNKVWIIFTIFIIAVAAFIFIDAARREKADLTVLMIANNGLETRQEELENFFEKYTDDLDGNGYVHVEVIMIPLNSHSDDYQQQNVNSTKFLAQLQGGESILVITDSNTDEEFKSIMTPELPKEFPNNKYVDDMGMSWNMEVMAKELNFENMPNDIHLSMRTPVKTLGDSKETMQENYDKAFKVFKRIVDDMTEKAVEAGDKGLTTEPVHYDDSSLESSDSTGSSENK